MNITMGPEKPADLEAMWQEIRDGEFPTHVCLHAICPTAFDPLQAPRPEACGVASSCRCRFNSRASSPEDWVRLKNGFMDSVLKIWRRYATNLTDDNIEMKVAMDPFYIAGRWPNMRRGSVWGCAQDRRTDWARNRPIEELADYRTPIAGPLPGRGGDASCRRRDRRLRVTTVGRL